jgi:hypothetical protein
VPNSQSSAKNDHPSSPQKPTTSNIPNWWPDPLKRIVETLSPKKKSSPPKTDVSQSVPVSVPQAIPSTSATVSGTTKFSDRLRLKAQAKASGQDDKKVEKKNEKQSSQVQTKLDPPPQASKSSRFFKKPKAPPTPGKNASHSTANSSSSHSTAQASQSTSLIPHPASSTISTANRRLDMSLPRFQLFDDRTSTARTSTSSMVPQPRAATGPPTNTPAVNDDDDAPDMLP